MLWLAPRHGAVLAMAWALAVSACGGAGTSVRSENNRLRAEVSQLRVRARADRRRIRDLKNEVVKLKGAVAELSTGDSGAVALPPLPVEVVTPEKEPEPDAAASAPRNAEPDVLLLTNRPRGRPPARHPHASMPPVPHAKDRLPVTRGPVPTVARSTAPKPRTTRSPEPAPEPAPEPKNEPAAERAAVGSETSPETDSTTERAAYKRYLAALFAGNHAYAVAGFKNFVARNPKHPLADNAQYWLGEAYYDQHDYHAATAAFHAVITHYPRGNKVPDAHLKIGYCRLKLGDTAGARRAFERLVSAHPQSAPARLAREQLEALEDRP